MNKIPADLFNEEDMLVELVNFSVILDENTANIIHHIVPVKIKVNPSSKNGSGP